MVMKTMTMTMTMTILDLTTAFLLQIEQMLE
jgi:hypothetical protein